MRRFHPDPVQKLALGALPAGGLAALAGDRLSLPLVVGVGTLVLALAPAVIGLRTMVTGRIRLPIDDYSEWEERYRGIGARAWGLLFLLMSVALAAFALLKLTGFEGQAGGMLDRWPGLAAVAVGIGLVLFGMAEASKVAILQRGQVRRVWRLPERIGGAITPLLGLALLAGGLLHTASPVLFDNVMRRLGRVLLALLER